MLSRGRHTEVRGKRACGRASACADVALAVLAVSRRGVPLSRDFNRRLGEMGGQREASVAGGGRYTLGDPGGLCYNQRPRERVHGILGKGVIEGTFDCSGEAVRGKQAPGPDRGRTKGPGDEVAVPRCEARLTSCQEFLAGSENRTRSAEAARSRLRSVSPPS